MKKINILQVGYGYWGKNILRDLTSIKECNVSLCDMNRQNLNDAIKKYDVACYDNFDKTIKFKANIDAVVLATPPETHYKLAFKALEKRKHTFIEKPMCLAKWEAKNLVEMAKIKKVKLMVGHTFCYNNSINYIRDYIRSGKLGKVKYIEFTMANLGKYQKNNVIYDLGPHGISIILHILGNKEIKNVKFSGLSAIKKDLIDVGTMILEWNDGFAVMNASWLYPEKTRKLVVVGDKAMLVFDDMNKENKIKIYDKGVNIGKIKRNKWGNSLVNYKDNGFTTPKIENNSPLKTELEHFVNCIIKNKTPITDGKNGLKIVSLIERALKNEKNN